MNKLRNMDSSINHGINTYSICRTLPIFSRLPDDGLKIAINASIETYLHELEIFDQALPAHFHRKSKAAWLEFTCVTVHVCNVLSNSCLSHRQATAMMQHIDLLYRVDDFMETLIDAYGIQDILGAFGALQRCFQPYLGSSTTLGSKRLRHARRRIDSPVEGVAPIAKPIELEHDLKDVVERMHNYPISEASEQDRRWYSLELYDFLVAQLEQLDSEVPKTVAPGQLHKWVTNVGARSVGTNYMFAMFTCLTSAEEGGRSLWKTASSLYLAQEFAQQMSVEFRVLNDVGGRLRDLRDGTMSSCALVRDGEYTELLKIAASAGERSAMLLYELVQGSDDGRKMRDWLEMFRRSVRVSGEICMAGEPNRGAS